MFEREKMEFQRRQAKANARRSMKERRFKLITECVVKGFTTDEIEILMKMYNLDKDSDLDSDSDTQ